MSYMPNEQINVAVAGAAGRMGRAVLELAANDARFHIAAALDSQDDHARANSIRVGEIDVPLSTSLTGRRDVLIDFTVAAGTMHWLEICRKWQMPMVIGATGHDEEQLAAIASAAHEIAIVKASNFSVGVQAMLSRVGALVKQMGPTFDVEIVEHHHRHKVDAPSGTALSLLDEILRATGRTRDDAVFGREGRTGPRPVGQIGIHAVRMGEIVGHHEVRISGPGETLSLVHTAHSRATFAAGALRAASWIVSRRAGLYSMADVLADQ